MPRHRKAKKVSQKENFTTPQHLKNETSGSEILQFGSQQRLSSVSSHNFSCNEVFYAKIVKAKGTYLFPHLLKPIVLLHPSAMKKFKFVCGEYVLISNNCDEQAFRCWPCESLSSRSIAFPQKYKLKQEVNSDVVVHNHYRCADLAVELNLTPKEFKDFMNSNDFTDYILKEYGGFFIRAGMVLSFCYLGSSCDLQVTRIASYDATCSNCEKSTVNNSLNYSSQFPSSSPCISNSEEWDESHSDSFLANCSNKMCSTPLSSKRQYNIETLAHSFMSQCSVRETNEQQNHKYLVIEKSTRIFLSKKKSLEKVSKKTVVFSDIHGVDKQLNYLKTLLYPYLFPHALTNDEKLPSGILLSGPSGTGKSLVCSAISNECQVSFISTRGQSYKKSSSTDMSNLRNLFQEASKRAPCILVIEDIDVICYTSDIQFSQKNQFVVDELIALIDGLSKLPRRKVVLIATTNRPECIDPTLRRPGRLEKDVRFDIPLCSERKEILKKLLENKTHSLTDDQIFEIASIAHGYTGLDLALVCNKSELRCALKNSDKKDCCLSYDDILYCLKESKPSSLNMYTAQVEKVHWDDIGGMQEVKQELIDMVDLPLKNPEAFETSGITPTHGILLFGPPGCSKTMIVKALATKTHVNFISVKGPELLRPFVGESESAVSELFRKASASAPCFIFFDEFESLASCRDSFGGSNVESRVLAQLLTEIDGIHAMRGVYIIAATNRPDLLDRALLRPGRFDRVIYVPLPDPHAREEILQIRLKKMPVSDDVDISKLVEATDGYTIAEIIAVCTEAGMQVLKEAIKKGDTSDCVVAMVHFTKALKMHQPRITREKVKFYENYRSEYYN